jgi:phage N-6-adenine-methyltransferase
MGEVEKSLSKLAEEINAEHRACAVAVASAVELVTLAELMPADGWREDEAGLPIFDASSTEMIDAEIIELRSKEGETMLRLAAVLTEASDKRFYGEGTLKRVCEENQINYSTGKSMVAAYRRLRSLEIVERSTIVSAILSGELFWSKVEIAASVDDDEAYAGLLNEAADGDLSASDLRERVHNHRALGTGDNEWYTPADVIEDVRRVLGSIELDPASSHAAQEVVGAEHFFTAEDNALIRDWFGKVFLNPPYSRDLMPHFVSKLVEEVNAGRVSEAIMLTHNYTDTQWFHTAFSAAQLICFTRGRIKFVSQDGELAPTTQGQAFFHFGENPQRFAEVFKKQGVNARPGDLGR